MMQLHKMVLDYFDEHALPKPEYMLYSSGEELLDSTEETDIAFLDVEMDGLSGIYTGERLKKKCRRVLVFIVTSYSDYLDEAMKFHVFRYLSKPIDKMRLFRNLDDAVFQINTYSKPIVIPKEHGYETVNAEDIVCIESVERHTKVYICDRTIICPQGIAFWNELTSDVPSFFATSRAFIINMKYVSAFDNKDAVLTWDKGSIRAYVARRKYKNFKDTYLLYMRSRI